MFQAFVIQVLVTGGVYALLAVGFSLIFGVARMINLAHTAFFMLAAYGMFFCSLQLGLDPISSIILSIVVTTLIAVASYKVFIDRIREHQVTVLLITIALAMVFQELMLLAFGAHFRAAPTLISGFWEIFGVRVTYQQLLSLGIVLVVLICVWAILLRTKLGIAIRATAQDAEIANLMGINVSRILLITMGIAAALAAISGVVVAPLWVVYPYMWLSPLVMVMAIVVLGGLGSIKGSVIGAFIIALVETLVVFLVPAGAFLKLAFALLAMVIILVVRPEGLFGVIFEEERL
ncbi:MAG: branched-chain amino acid ABC transporter permease [Chloroflexi bacterium]|nr:branched-chain amino acid ABC transporter permease [Chloroflexota bacterium]MBL7061460.1 branched-chain amino acid ABC transporter permease [Dehalococcoidia bacterium]